MHAAYPTPCVGRLQLCDRFWVAPAPMAAWVLPTRPPEPEESFQ
jgi:hypothetical protein